MAAEGLIDFEELRTWLSALEENRNTAERELHTLRHYTERLERLERDRDSLLESYGSYARSDRRAQIGRTPPSV